MNCKNFHPELSTDIMTEGDGGLAYPSERIYENYLSRLERLNQDLKLNLQPQLGTVFTPDQVEKKLVEAEQIYNTIHDVESTLSSLTDDDRIALDKLHEYPLDDIENGFVSIGFGRVPTNSLSKIVTHYNERFVFTELHRTKHYGWILYVCLKEDTAYFEELFESLYFEPLVVPKSTEEHTDYNFNEALDAVYGYVKNQSLKESYYKYITIYNEEATIAGFIPAARIQKFEGLFDDRVKTHKFEPEAQPNLLAPTRLVNGWFAAPFEMLVEMYGLPKYGQFDPTKFFAITYALLFGIMFGDVGQGIVISLMGYYLYKKKGMKLGGVMARIGIFSTFFGFLYGSVFGNEELLMPLLKPIGLPIHVQSPSMTMNLLISTVAIGVVLILTAIAMNTFLSIRRKDYDRGLFSQNGLAGLIFYGFVMAAIVAMALGSSIINPLTIVLFIAIPLAVILFKEPLTNFMNKVRVTPHEGWGGYIVEGFFELFEVLLGFVTNTMSFLRVGGFILSHAGMMSVVMTLKDMSGNAGILVMILGNILVIGLEGLIVGIQTLRLEYYEMFSRFYDGGGKPFKSVN